MDRTARESSTGGFGEVGSACQSRGRSYDPGMKGTMALPVALMLVFALSRIPGMLPQNFSAAYALTFCAGVYFSRRMAWWLPFTTLLLTDIGLNVYYLHLGWPVFELPILKYQLFNFVAYAVLIWVGRRFDPRASFAALLGGGILGAILFYLITNTASWLYNPEYPKTFAGWIQALTNGTQGNPPTWTFFRNTLISGGLFTGLFAGAFKLTAEPEPAEEKEPKEAPAEEPEAEPATEEA